MAKRDNSTTSISNGIGDFSKESRFKVKVITDVDEFDQLRQSWNELVETSEVTIFQTFEWNRIWWKHFGADKELHIITVFEKDTLVAIVPLFVDTVIISGWEISSCLRFIGSSVNQPEGEELKGLMAYSDYLDVIIHPDYTEQVYQTFVTYFKETDINHHEIILEEVPENSILSSLLVDEIEKFDIKYRITEESVCPIITLEDRWGQYLDRLSGSARYKVRKYLKKAYEPKHKVFDIDHVNDWENGLCLYEKLVKLHQKRWNEAGYPGAFAETRYYNFLKEASRLFISRGWAELVAARSPKDNNEYVAVDLIYKYRKDVSLVHRAYDIDAESSDESPGNVLLYDSVKKAIGEGFTVFDFLRGAEPYKFRSANTKRENKKIRVFCPDQKGRLIAYLARRFIYYKRRLYIEYLEAKTIFEDKNMAQGILDYFSFLKSRL